MAQSSNIVAYKTKFVI